jgi:hypothetical protein
MHWGTSDFRASRGDIRASAGRAVKLTYLADRANVWRRMACHCAQQLAVRGFVMVPMSIMSTTSAQTQLRRVWMMGAAWRAVTAAQCLIACMHLLVAQAVLNDYHVAWLL